MIRLIKHAPKRKGTTRMGNYRITSTAARLCLIAITLGLIACNQTPQITDDDITLIDDVQLIELLKQQQDVVIVDVRPDYRYRTGHLPNAINIPLQDLKPDDPRFTEAGHLVVYADGPRNTLSQAAAKKLLAAASVPVSDFRGGFEMWKRNDHQIITGQ